MYGSYGAFKRLGLSTSSHREPTMTQNEWKAAYATSNNLQQPRHLLRRPPAPPPVRLQRSPSTHAAVSAMVTAARAMRQANAGAAGSGGRARAQQQHQRADRKEEEEGEDDEDAEFLSDDDVDEDERPPASGVERLARADRRLAELKKRHRAEQEKQAKRAKTARTRTMKRSTSDVELPSPSSSSSSTDPAHAAPEQSDAADDVALPSLGGAAVGDVRERTRLLLREALLKRDPDAPPHPLPSSTSQRKAAATRKRKAGEVAEERAEEGKEEEDAHTLLASDIEQELFELHQSSPSKAYRQQSRDLVYALVHNAQLAPDLLTLRLLPAQLVALPKEQLASHARASVRLQEKAEMTRDLVLGQAEGARSDEWLCQACGSRQTETFVLKEGRDLRKAEVWGGGGDDVQSVILVRCLQCKREWKKEV